MNPAADQFVAQSRQALAEGAYKKAEQFALKAIGVEPESPAAHNAIGEAFLRQGRFDDAYAEFAFAVGRAPNVPEYADNLRKAAHKSPLAAGRLIDDPADDPRLAAQVIRGIAEERYAARGVLGRMAICSLVALAAFLAVGYGILTAAQNLAAFWRWMLAAAGAALSGGLCYYGIMRRLFRRELKMMGLLTGLADSQNRRR